MSQQRSPVISGCTFALPFVDVVSPIPAVDTSSAEEAQDESVNLMVAQAVNRTRRGPVAVLNRFISLGIPRERTGIRHTLFFTKKPVNNLYTVQDDCKVSGYLSYSYLYCGSVVVGIVFSSDNSKTSGNDYKLVVRGKETPVNFAPNFNLEKMGLLLFIAEDSSTLVIPNDIESSLLVRTE